MDLLDDETQELLNDFVNDNKSDDNDSDENSNLKPIESPHTHSASLTDMLSPVATRIQSFLYHTNHDDNMTTPRESKIYDIKNFIVKENEHHKKSTANAEKLNKMLIPVQPTIRSFQSNDDHIPITDYIKDSINKDKLTELLLPVTPTISKFQSNEEHIKFDDALFDKTLTDDDDFEKEIETLLISLELTNNFKEHSIQCNSVKTCGAIKRLLLLMECYQNINSNLIETLKKIENEKQL
eukprot:463938_1